MSRLREKIGRSLGVGAELKWASVRGCGVRGPTTVTRNGK